MSLRPWVAVAGCTVVPVLLVARSTVDQTPAAHGHPAADADAGATPAIVPCLALRVPATPPVPAPGCTAAAPRPDGGLLLDGVRVGLAEEDDDVLVVDPRCDGSPVALVRRPDGEVFAFADPPPGVEPVYAVPLTHGPTGAVLATDGADCPTATLTTADGHVRVVDLRPIGQARP